MWAVDVDGHLMMCNDREAEHWRNTGRFERIMSGDAEDADYIAKRDEIIAAGDEAYYKSIIPKHDKIVL